MIRTIFIAAACIALASASCTPKFPNDWNGLVINSFHSSQGGVPYRGIGILCPTRAPQCKVQTGYSAGQQYFDYSHNRTAFKNPDGSGVVTLFNVGKEFGVFPNGTCQSYCPIDFPMIPLNVEDMTDEGKATYRGNSYEKFVHRDLFPILNVTMEEEDFYVDCSTPSSAVPIADIDHITPFGINLALQNNTWVSFKAGPQDDSHFTVNGMDSCPEDPQCEQQRSHKSVNMYDAARMSPLFMKYIHKTGRFAPQEEVERMIKAFGH